MENIAENKGTYDQKMSIWPIKGNMYDHGQQLINIAKQLDKGKHMYTE